MFSTRFLLFLLLTLASVAQPAAAQSIAELEARLQTALEPADQWDTRYKLARNWLTDAPDKAAVHAQKAVELAEQLQDKKRLAQSLLVAAEVAHSARKWSDARALYVRAHDAARSIPAPDLVLQAVERLTEIAVAQKDFQAAYTWGQERSTLLQEKARREADLQRQKYEAAQDVLAAQKARENRIVIGALLLVLLAMALFYRWRQRSNRRVAGQFAEKNALIEEKRRRSEQLLLNILPKAVANELTIRNKVLARRYERVTVMFIDFVGFTHAAEGLDPEVLVAELDHCFSQFDEIISRMRIEKIKTVGDAYICASGLTDRNESPREMLVAALRMQEFLQQLKAKRQAAGRPHFEARIGVHFGPVVAGVVGTRKFAYDIWGDTVNTAARTEEASAAGKINVTAAVQAEVADQFEWEYRGQIATKNKAEMGMYFLIDSIDSIKSD